MQEKLGIEDGIGIAKYRAEARFRRFLFYPYLLGISLTCPPLKN
jgi:hypothetical protein